MEAATEVIDVPETGTTTFVDKNNISWDVDLTLESAMRVDASDFSKYTDLKFSILNPKRETLVEILTNTPLCFAVIWAIVQPQVKEKLGLDPANSKEQEEGQQKFVAGIGGDQVATGREALWGAITNFFPEHRTGLYTVLRQHKKALEKVGQGILDMETEIETIIGEEIAENLLKFKQKLKEDRQTP